MRVGFTIIFNGEHHLRHNNFFNNMLEAFDMWVIVEGLAKNGGSTSWCNSEDIKLDQESGLSTDGTSELLMELWTNHPKVEYITHESKNSLWNSKDDMVNAACDILSMGTNGCKEPIFLWQIDCDEQWTIEDMTAAERELIEQCADTGCFHSNYYVGKNLVTKGLWGEGNDRKGGLTNAYRRLWLWKGQPFVTHEPPVIEGGNKKEVLLSQRFNHFAYYFDEDVKFKEKYYGYHNLYKKWKLLQEEKNFPQPVSRLIPGGWGNTDTKICKI